MGIKMSMEEGISDMSRAPKVRGVRGSRRD